MKTNHHLAYNHLSFAAFDDFQLAYESNMQVKHSHLLAELNSAPDAHGESRPVSFYAHDGNDYWLINTGCSYWLIATTVPVAPTVFCDIIAFEEHQTLRGALQAMSEIVITDSGDEQGE